MTVERRLHHAARDLREVPIDVPPLCGIADLPARRVGTRRPRLATLAAPTLFVVGGIFAVGAIERQVPEPAHSDIPAATTDAGADTSVTRPTGVAAGPSAPSVRDELQLIAGILHGSRAPSEIESGDAGTAISRRVALGPR